MFVSPITDSKKENELWLLRKSDLENLLVLQGVQELNKLEEGLFQEAEVVVSQW